jgi:hypothetical protein
MTIDILFQEFVQLEEGEKKAFLKKALSYLLDDGSGDIADLQLEEAKRRVLAFEDGQLKSTPAKEVEKKLELKYGFSS